MNYKNNIPVIDLFAGPGGLGEGFATYTPKASSRNPFKISASVEMDVWAHQTLELRSFFHEFKRGHAPDEYYRYLQQKITKDELFTLYPKQAAAAKKRAILAELGKEEDDNLIRKRLDEILNKNYGQPWVLIGGPPCQAYSIIGRSRRQANGIGYQNQNDDHRNFLYLRYLDIIARYKPTVFVMENVKGILSAKVNGERIFDKIMHDLRHPKLALADSQEQGYTHNGLEYKVYSLVIAKEDNKELDPKDYIIKSENYGVPQARHRVIFLGIRSDVDIKPSILKSKNKSVVVESLLADLPKLRSSFTRPVGNTADWYKFISDIRNQKWCKQYVPAFKVSSSIGEKVMLAKINESLENLQTDLTTGSEFIKFDNKIAYRPKWFYDPKLGGVINHIARGHMKEDLYRYFFAATFTHAFNRSPRMRDFPRQLLPKHKNVGQSLKKVVFDDRFRVQQANKPASTVTSHISKDGHYYIHYDSSQCRSLTVREAARLQSFPDNYYFIGPRTQQYHQVGNAVPPLLASQVANIVYDVIKKLPQPDTVVSDFISNKNSERANQIQLVII